MQTQVSCSEQEISDYHDNNQFNDFVDKMNKRFDFNLSKYGNALFETDVDLFKIYLETFPEEVRQYHNCHCCKNFLQRFGNLVFIDESGHQISAMWEPSDAPDHYKDVTEVMKMVVENSSIIRQFHSSHYQWGERVTGQWFHFGLSPDRSIVHNNKVKSANELMAEKVEDYRILCDSIRDFSRSNIEVAMLVIQSDTLYRSEKVEGPARWFEKLHNDIDKKRGNTRKRIIWRAVALAPVGYTHIRSSMIGTLLEDIKSGMNHADVIRRFASKMHPLRYQRPQAQPSAGNIKQAEEIVKKLGIENSLKRRYAKLSEMMSFWEPAKASESKTGGVFAGLLEKQIKAITVDLTDTKSITWEKFERTVLELCNKIELYVPNTGPFSAFLTAEDMSAPPIIQWDSDMFRNPVSWYFHSGPSKAYRWNLNQSSFVEVKAMGYKPNMIGPFADSFKHQGRGVMFALEDCKDMRGANACLFPEIMKSELHSIRSTIEAHSNSQRLGTPDYEVAAGVLSDFEKERNHVILRTTLQDGRRMMFKIDRWD